MSAICALYRFDDRPIENAAVDRVLRGLDTWGTGGSNTWVDSTARVGLGCRLRPVTPEDAFDVQPLVSGDGMTALVADARIDNRLELAADLGIAASEAAGLPDTAFILAAWRAWGSDCPRRLVGDFAFALWDGTRDTLVCARDPIGQRVLFQHRGPGRLVLATTISALLDLPDVPVHLNEQKIAELLVLLEDSESTCFEGITRVRPGHVLIANRDGASQRRYWFPDTGRRIVLGSDAEYREAFRSVFRRAVLDRLRSTSPVAMLLSGGLDSSSVAGMAADALKGSGGRLAAFHAAPEAGFAGASREGWINDETADVRALADMHANIDLTVLQGQHGSPLDDAEPLFEVLCAPVRNSMNLTWVRQIYEVAAKQGAGVMLNGGKGNLTISYTGLRSITDMAKRGRIFGALNEARAVAAVREQRARDVIRDQILLPLVPTSILAWYGSLRNGSRPPIWERSLSAIQPEFARAMRVEEIARERHDDDVFLSRASAPEYRYSVIASGGDGFDVAHSMRGWIPIETREATTDLRVIEFCLAIPGSQYLQAGHDRLLIRRGMRDLVPASILNRTTRGAQAADWPNWFGRMRTDMTAELHALRDVDLARRSLDLDRMQTLVDNWPERFGPEHVQDYGMLLLRGIMMGKFIRWVQDRWQ